MYVESKVDLKLPKSKLLNLIREPENLNKYHPFCKRNSVISWPGNGSEDQLEYHNGMKFNRNFYNWSDSGYDLNNTENPAALSDSIRGVFAITSGSAYKNAIDYINIQTLGDALDFGDLTDIRGYGAALASSTRGCFIGGLDTTGPAPDLDIDVIDFVTIRSTGNATDFGDRTHNKYNVGSCAGT